MLLSLLTLVLCAQATPPDAPANAAEQAAPGASATESSALVRRAAEQLAAVGCTLELERLSLTTRARADCLADTEAQLALFFPSSYYAAMRALYAGLGVELGRDDEGARTQIARAMLGGLVAYYQCERRELVLIGAQGDEPPAGAEAVVRHELVHAWRDARSSLARLFGAPLTLEQARIVQCLSEGEAEALSLAAELVARGDSLAALAGLELDDPLARLLAGESLSLPYTFGRRFALARLRAGGIDALEQAWSERPPSSEALLHASKAGTDRPTAVVLALEAPAGARLVHTDELGEMGLLSLLLERGVEREQAWLAALGWDGDRLACFERAGERGLAWRSVWDREADAAHVETLWRSLARGSVQRRGRVVDWCHAGSAELQQELARALASTPFDEAVAAGSLDDGAASTEALERERLVRERPRLEDGRWIVPAAGLALDAPAGWSARELQGTAFLLASARAGFADNANVLLTPGARPASLAEERAQYAARLEAAGLELVDASERELDGRACLLVHARGVVAGRELAFTVLLAPSEAGLIELTFSVLAARAEELAPALEAALSSLSWR